jgi:phosphoserine phosphatase
LSRFNTVVLDVDSTLSGVEGIDWLAALRGPAVEAWSADLTAKAMEGTVPIEAVYGERMRVVKPTLAEVGELGQIYVDRIAIHARETLRALRARDVGLVMVSGGLREAILPLARELGVEAQRVHAVPVFFDHAGQYAGFDESSPFTRQSGKMTAVGEMALKGPVLAVGDGMTDCEMRAVVDSFAAYTGFTRREPVLERADYVLGDFDELRKLVLE